MTSAVHPTRFLCSSATEATFGTHRAQKLKHALFQGDALGDAAALALSSLSPTEKAAALQGSEAAPLALRALLKSSQALPLWVDTERCRRGGQVLLKAGILSGLALGFKSLISGYCSPGGNKPLMFTRRLEDDLPQRLHDTARFVRAVCATGVEAGTSGFHAALHVRLIHSRVRLSLSPSLDWKQEHWGTPINQYDMAGTILLFSHVLMQGIEAFGMHLSPDEKEDVIHLWRSIGHVMGVDHELLPSTAREAETVWNLLEATQALPDADAVRLTKALLEGPLKQAKGRRQLALAKQWVKFSYQTSRALLGDRYADALEYPKASALPSLFVLKSMVAQGDFLRRWIPTVDNAALKWGELYWDRTTRAPQHSAPSN
jgi:ER-bound oxygenase mpaB/B'/Rubber oxygenase, catalytic domain